MKDVVLKVHPLSRCVLLSEYGATEPLVLNPHDLVFSILLSAPVREPAYIRRSIHFLTQPLELRVPDDAAEQLFQRPYHAGALLYKYHKDQMCRYAQVAVRNGGEAWSAIEQWLYMHDVADETYSMDAAYKCWLRWNANFSQKNRVFFGRMRSKSSVRLAKKTAVSVRAKMLLPEPEIEVALGAFLDALRQCYPGTPARFPHHARAYFYKAFGGLSEKQVSGLLGIPRATVGYGYRSMRNWLETTPSVRCALAKSTGLPAV
jgi:hypothetical protein